VKHAVTLVEQGDPDPGPVERAERRFEPVPPLVSRARDKRRQALIRGAS
jgi:hypothetical protein